MMNPKEKAIVDRIARLENAITKAREYLDTGAHAQWSGFRPWFYGKTKDGKELPPHRDWVKNVFLPRHEKALHKSHRTLEKLTQKHKERRTMP